MTYREKKAFEEIERRDEEIELVKSSFYKALEECNKLESHPEIPKDTKNMYELKKSLGLYTCFVRRFGMDLFTIQAQNASYNRIKYFLDAEKENVDALMTSRERFRAEQAS